MLFSFRLILQRDQPKKTGFNFFVHLFLLWHKRHQTFQLLLLYLTVVHKFQANCCCCNVKKGEAGQVQVSGEQALGHEPGLRAGRQ